MLENEKKFFFQKHPHPHPRHSTCSALASWASSGSVPLGKATIPPFILSLCVSLSLKLSVSYIVLRVLVRACRQEELHGGGATVARGINESRPVILYMRGKRMEDGVSERQKRGTTFHSLSLCVLISQALSLLPRSSRPCPRLPPGGASRRRCDR